jgi:2-aminobenzoate-CoA ligase
MTPSAYRDSFAADRLPPREQWPDFRFALPGLSYPERLNAVTELLDAHLARGHGPAPCLIGADGATWSYAETAERVNRIANALARIPGFEPGKRVLLRAPNSPLLAAVYLAVLKAGGIVVATMPMLRARELSYIIGKARIEIAFCAPDLMDELERAAASEAAPPRIVAMGGELKALMEAASPAFEACDTAATDVCLIGFTSGTTGEPKATLHFHRDLLAICDAYGQHVLKARADDRFIGSPPLAFTFGLGGLVLFPLRVGASTILLERASPDDLLGAMAALGPTICFTAPTAYRAILARLAQPGAPKGAASSLRICVSAGEALPLATFNAWKDATGIVIQDGIGATEMLHIFISAAVEEVRPGATGKAVPGYEAKVIDAEGRDLPPGSIGRLAVRGPTGCRYMADPRQAAYVQDGWNVTGDAYRMDEDGYFWYQARSDDMIISAGYNIAGPEVEASLLAHPAVAECGVVGVADEERGMIVKAYVVLKDGHAADDAMVRTLQDHVKADIAPYKYPRAVAFVDALPRTETGKLQRFALRRIANEGAGGPGDHRRAS